MTFLVFFILFVTFIAVKLYWYYLIWWFDMPMHFLGGFFLGFLAFYLYIQATRFSFTRQLLYVFLFTLSIGIGWELYEIIFNNILAGVPFNTLDTLSDICFDVSGGVTAFLFLLYEQHKREYTISICQKK